LAYIQEIPHCLSLAAGDNLSMDDRAPWVPRRSQAEGRKVRCELLYDLEMEFRRQDFLADPALVYDEEHDLFRFRDGKFAFSRACYELG
jgi:hypothetical protein